MGRHRSMSTPRAAILVVLTLVATSCGGAEADPSVATPVPTTALTTTAGASTTNAVATVTSSSTMITAVPTTTSFTPAVEPELAIATVESAIGAFNAGDVDGWHEHFATASSERECESWGCFVQLLMNANERIQILQPCQLVAPATVGCEVFISNDFHGPAGISSTSVATFELDADLKIADWESHAECCDQQLAFNSAFHRWLRETHRDVFEEIRPHNDNDIPGFRRDSGYMTIALRHVAQFIESSDEYPLRN